MGCSTRPGRLRRPGRKDNTLRKLDRMNKALRHEEPDRVPISDFFWGGFIRRWREELGLPADANPYYYYDLDWIVTVPNMDPWIRPFETLKETAEEVVVKTGFGAIMRKVFDCPMPEFIAWEIDTLEKLEAAEFDDPRDRRRFFSAGDNQIAGVGDGFERNSPPWVETVKSLWPDFPVYGSMIECSECMTRLIGPQNHMLWMALEPERMGAVVNRMGQFYLECAKAAIDAAGLAGRLRDLGRRGLQERHLHAARLLADVLQALGQGDRRALPRPGAGGDLPRLRQRRRRSSRTTSRWASTPTTRWRSRPAWTRWTCAAASAIAWASAATATSRSGRRATARPSAARCCASSTPAKGGGFIFQSDHSVSSAVSGQTYDYIVQAGARVRPLSRCDLGEFDETR